ncbi:MULTISPECIES: ABC transporter permease [Bacillus cereus group]|jgi:ABC-2 type transport system permease protein|uniref:ABC transporter permease n=1 Tax=Bacillus cereus group TaxID=86661 RepID=UPI000944A8D5|nr:MULTISPECIES: ABC transporter permease [Bacillus cereus group]MEB9548414.1 ABC transporter permease [Bacillus cereus]MEB9568799.1 ABC transporter permease [Bacillus cereus]NUH88101.1 ABC transporter permease [Bacillus thuringiensis]NUH94707.1 ABC transporter permease [Bacillus thuringiensis]NUH99453.1 ABC transporter permease [Bacillus thuringiensis]
MRNFWIVLGQTYWDRVRTKIFIGMTLLLIGGGIFLFSFPTLVQKFSGEKEKAKVVFISEAPNVTLDQSNLSKALPEWDWSLGDKTKLNQYKQDLLDKKVEALFILKEGAGAEPVLDYFMKVDNPKLIQSAQVFVQNQYFQSAVVKQQLSEEAVKSLTMNVQAKKQNLNNEETSSFLLVYLLVAIMYLAITSYGNAIATAVASEKASRVMEVMVTKVSPVHMVFGKILGVGLASLTQLFIFFFSMALYIKSGIFKVSDSFFGVNIDVNMITGEHAAYFLLYFVLGYFVYAALFAVFGSMVSRPEELSGTTMPITLILMGSLVVELLVVLDNPEGLVSRVTSYVPFTAPISMVVRIINGSVSGMEIAASILVLLSSISLISLFAAKVYPKGILRSGKSLKLFQLLKNS